MTSSPKRKIIVFSGGSAANSLVDVFNEVVEGNNCTLTYIIPISDNGGSSSELIRVFGGPGIGDVRSTYRLKPAIEHFLLVVVERFAAQFYEQSHTERLVTPWNRAYSFDSEISVSRSTRLSRILDS